MAARVLTIAQGKGGAGKTTLAVQLAVALRNTGKSVALMDIDPQKSLSGWHAVRMTRDPAAQEIDLSAVAGWRVGTELDRLRGSHDYVIIDSPPHAETETKHALNAADLALIPLQPSPMDLWATKATIDAASRERAHTLIVLNRVPPRAKVTAKILAAIKDQGLRAAKTSIGNRTAFASSMMEGLGVTEAAKRSVAAAEINALLQEVRRLIK
ncbi:MAG: ParA family partition ATPase [Magnetospiraceae bacterium]